MAIPLGVPARALLTSALLRIPHHDWSLRLIHPRLFLALRQGTCGRHARVPPIVEDSYGKSWQNFAALSCLLSKAACADNAGRAFSFFRQETRHPGFSDWCACEAPLPCELGSRQQRSGIRAGRSPTRPPRTSQGDVERHQQTKNPTPRLSSGFDGAQAAGEYGHGRSARRLLRFRERISRRM